MKSEKDKKFDTIKNVGINMSGSEKILRHGDAVSEYVKAYTGEIGANGKRIKGLKDIAKHKIDRKNPQRSIKQHAGSSAEVFYEAKTNAENILNGKKGRIRRTDAIGKVNHQEFDHVATDKHGIPILDNNGNYTNTAQMKFRGNNAKENIEKFVNSTKKGKSEFDKYKNVESLDIPSDQFKEAKKYIQERKASLNEQIDALKSKENKEQDLANLQDELARYESVDKRLRDTGIPSKKAEKLYENPLIETAREIHKVAHKASWEQAKLAAAIGGGVSLAKNFAKVVSGEKKEVDLKEISVDFVKDSGGAGLLTYGVTYTGIGIKTLMNRSQTEFVKTLSKTNLPATIATTAFEVGKSIKRYLTEDDFDELALMKELGEKGTGMLGASIGAAAGSIVPGVGTVVGGMIGGTVGYMAGALIYNSCIDLIKEVEASEQKRKIIQKISDEALLLMEKERKELELLIDTHCKERAEIFQRCFQSMKNSIVHDDHNIFVANLSELGETLGFTLKYTDFDEFDKFMLDDDQSFVF